MRIFAGGIGTETNTFSPICVGLEDFVVVRPDAAEDRARYPSLDLTSIWGDPARRAGHIFTSSLMAWAPPGGLTVASAYQSLKKELLDDLRAAGEIDVVLLMLHGAMISEDCSDCEEDLIRAVRQIVGKDVIIGVELDLHAHLHQGKIEAADIVIAFKEYPHTDMGERAAELLDLAIKAREGAVTPVMTIHDCNMAGLYPTTREPLRSFVDEMVRAEADPILSLSFIHGYHFADTPHMGAKILAVADADRRIACEVGERLVARLQEIRAQIGCESFALPMESALREIGSERSGLTVIADQSDNTGSGAPGDATFVLEWLIDQRVGNVAIAIIHDPEVVRAATKAGAGARLAVRLGGKTGVSSGLPLDLDVQVTATARDYVHRFPQTSGPAAAYPVGDVVALECGGIDIVVGSIRCQPFSPDIFSDLGIDWKARSALIVKSAQHFYSGFAPFAKRVIYMNAPGAVPQDPRLLNYRHVPTQQLYPWKEA